MARGVSPSGAAKPLADEAITTTLRPPRVSLMLFIVARCHCPRRADVPGRRYPPPPREDRAVLAQADLRPAGPAGLIYLRYVTETVGRDEPAGHRQPAGADRVGPGRPAGRGPRPGRHLDQSAGVAEQRAAPPHRRGRPLPRGRDAIIRFMAPSSGPPAEQEGCSGHGRMYQGRLSGVLWAGIGSRLDRDGARCANGEWHA